MIAAMYHVFCVSDNWLVSTLAKKVYVASALLTVFFFGLLFAIVFGATTAGGTLAQVPLLASLLKAMLLIGILGAALLWTGMWYFWFRFHPSEGMSKALWAAAFIVMASLGSLLYFVFVYLRSSEVRALDNAQPVAS